MIAWLSRAGSRLAYIYKSAGLLGALRQLAAKLVSPIYSSDTAYLTLSFLGGIDVERDCPPRVDALQTEGMVVESVTELEALRDEIPPQIPYDRLREHMDLDGHFFIVVARRPAAEGGMRVIGYRLFGNVYSEWHGKVRGELPPDAVMFFHNEVIPECRGQRAQQVMRYSTYAYCLAHGYKTLVGAIRTHNRSSIRSFKKTRSHKDNIALRGPIRHVRWFGGLRESFTPWHEIEAMIRAFRDDCVAANQRDDRDGAHG